MDTETYEQMHVDQVTIGDNEQLMQENMEIIIATTPEGEIVSVELPTTVVQTIAESEPNVKGNTASGSGKVGLHRDRTAPDGSLLCGEAGKK
jgi:elongation factor P